MRCRSAREKSRLGQDPLGTKTRAVVVAYTSIKKVAIGCLTIHDLSGKRCGPNIGSWLSHDRYSSRQRHHEAAPTASFKAGPRVRHHRQRRVDDISFVRMLEAWFRTVGIEHTQSSNISIAASGAI